MSSDNTISQRLWDEERSPLVGPDDDLDVVDGNGLVWFHKVSGGHLGSTCLGRALSVRSELQETTSSKSLSKKHPLNTSVHISLANNLLLIRLSTHATGIQSIPNHHHVNQNSRCLQS
jgi:hypothetical protein